jgi:Leucine-rich repeat (LRR) protein
MKKIFFVFGFCFFFLSLQHTFAQVINDTAYVYHSISAATQNPEKVFKLNLSKRKLKTFPQEIFQFRNLRELDLSRNKFDSIPKELGSLKNLVRLNLSNNKLESVPDEIGNLTQLVYLGLNRNKIVELPTTIGILENLEVLELWDNELSKIPDEVANLKKLKVLELRGILFSDDEAARINSLLPDAKVLMSPSCNCKY